MSGRSAGSGNFVGLTSKKFEKAAYFTQPDKTSRVVPSATVEEYKPSYDDNCLV